MTIILIMYFGLELSKVDLYEKYYCSTKQRISNVNDVFADVNVVNIKLSQELLTRSEQLEPKDGLSLRPR